jgi:phage head maturation protease
MRLFVIRSGAPAGLGGATAEQRAASGKAYYSASAPAAGCTDDVMTMRFSPYDVWYEVNSWWEGNFMERTVRGAFAKTMTERGGQVKCLLNHGMEFDIGDKPLGVPIMLSEESDSARMDAACLDTSYMRDQVIPGVRAGAYGSSFMFEVLGETWDKEPAESDTNPRALPERTITQVRLYEDGPVTWPANPSATSEMNSAGTDQFMNALRSRDQARYDALSDQYAGFRAQHRTDIGRSAPTVIDLKAPEPAAPASGEPDRHVGVSAASRSRTLELLQHRH